MMRRNFSNIHLRMWLIARPGDTCISEIMAMVINIGKKPLNAKRQRKTPDCLFFPNTHLLIADPILCLIAANRSMDSPV